MEKENKENKEKYETIIEWIANQPYDLGETQLNKVLFFSDVEYYKKHKKTITGDKYIKNHYGPTALELPSIIKGMLKNHKIVETFKIKKGCRDFQSRVISPVRKVDNDKLNKYLDPEKIDILLQSLRQIANKSARDVSEETHTAVYHVLEDKKEIPNHLFTGYFDEEIPEEKIQEYINLVQKVEVEKKKLLSLK